MMRICLTLLTAALTTLAACTEFPELDGTISPELANARPPALVPLAPLLEQAAASDSGGALVQTEMEPRIAALRARAARLRGPVIPPAARARMLRGVR